MTKTRGTYKRTRYVREKYTITIITWETNIKNMRVTCRKSNVEYSWGMGAGLTK